MACLRLARFTSCSFSFFSSIASAHARSALNSGMCRCLRRARRAVSRRGSGSGSMLLAVRPGSAQEASPT
jgi:hypothetical protein